MRFFAEPRQVEVLGVEGRRVDESVMLRIVGARNLLAKKDKAAADAVVELQLEPGEALQLLEAVTRALFQLGYDVVDEAAKSHGRRRGG